MSTPDAKTVVKRYFEMALSGDPNLPSLFDDEIRWSVPEGSALGGVHAGRDAVLKLLDAAFTLYDGPTMKVEHEVLFGEGEWVCVLLHMDAKTAKGRDWSSDYAFVFRVVGEKILEVREFPDTKRLAEIVFAD